MRIVEKRKRNTPIGDGAFRIGLERFLEYFLGCPVPERMLISHRAIKPALRRLIARRREVDRAKFLIGIVLCDTRAGKSKRCDACYGNCK